MDSDFVAHWLLLDGDVVWLNDNGVVLIDIDRRRRQHGHAAAAVAVAEVEACRETED